MYQTNNYQRNGTNSGLYQSAIKQDFVPSEFYHSNSGNGWVIGYGKFHTVNNP